MAKQKKSNVSKKKIDTILLVTETNRKFCIVLGRKCYAYQRGTTQFNLLGEFLIRPRLIKGKYIADGVVTQIYNEEDRHEYADTFKSVIDTLIKEKKLYIDQAEPLVKFGKN